MQDDDNKPRYGTKRPARTRSAASPDGLRPEQRLRRLGALCREAGLAWWHFTSLRQPGWCSPALCPLLGLPPSDDGADCELSLRALLRQLPPTDRRRLLDAVRHRGATRDFALTLRVNGRDGQVRWLRLRAEWERSRGRPPVLRGTAMDASREEQLLRKVQDLETLMSGALDNVHDAVLVLEADGRLRHANRRAVQMLGIGEDAVVSVNWQQLDAGKAWPTLQAMLQQASQPEPLLLSCTLCGVDGNTQQVQLQAVARRLDGGPVLILTIAGPLDRYTPATPTEWMVREPDMPAYGTRLQQEEDRRLH